MTVERIKELKEIEREIKALEKMAEEIKNEIKEEMGNEEHIEIGGYKVNYTITISTRLDSKKLKEEMPTIYNQFIAEQISRRFSIN